MKLCQLKGKNGPSLGIYTENGIVDVKAEGERRGLPVPGNMMELIAGGRKGLKSLSAILDSPECFSDSRKAEAVSSPGKILCIGLNYRRHAKECGLPLPEKPVLFNKFGNALAADRAEVVLPSAYNEYDYEAELVVIIGRKCRNVKKEDALGYVFGYTCGNDISTRDLQFARGGQWVLSKTFDSFAPTGPYVVTADEIDPQNLHIWSTVNGEMRQNSSTSDMIFSVSEIIEDLSSHFTLEPGDIIFTGTPEGVMQGYGEDEKSWLKGGDTVEVGIDSIGTLTTYFVSEGLNGREQAHK